MVPAEAELLLRAVAAILAADQGPPRWITAEMVRERLLARAEDSGTEGLRPWLHATLQEVRVTGRQSADLVLAAGALVPIEITGGVCLDSSAVTPPVVSWVA